MMSDGIKSGVNWIRLYVISTAFAIVVIINVLASPGTPISRAWLRLNIAISTFFTTSSCPTITFAISSRKVLYFSTNDSIASMSVFFSKSIFILSNSQNYL